MYWRKNKFYATHIDSDAEVIGYRASYFYLHGKAEHINGYDICTANGEALRNCMRRGAFLCELICIDGIVRDAICFSHFRCGYRMEGLICLLEDNPSIEYISKNEGIFADTPMMLSDEIEYLISIGKYNLIKH